MYARVLAVHVLALLAQLLQIAIIFVAIGAVIWWQVAVVDQDGMVITGLKTFLYASLAYILAQMVAGIAAAPLVALTVRLTEQVEEDEKRDGSPTYYP